MKTTEKFKNGMSIMLLEERYEMCLTVGRGRNNDCPHQFDSGTLSIAQEQYHII